MANYNSDNPPVFYSQRNPRIKRTKQLHTKKGRRIQKKFIAQGLTVCATLMEAGLRPTAVFCLQKGYPDIAHYCRPELITCVIDEVMQALSTTASVPPVLCVFPIPELPVFNVQSGLVLAGIADPGNMGTIIRSAVAMNVPVIYTIDTVDVWSPKVVQASAGYITSIPIIACSWEQLVTEAGSVGLPLLAAIAQGGESYKTYALAEALLVIGSEAHGIPQEQLENCSAAITLPMPGKIESLNAAVAASIIMYLGYVERSAGSQNAV